MAKGKIVVTFHPMGTTVSVQKGVTIQEAASQAGISLDSPCGGQGTCGKCRVRVLDHTETPNPAGMALLRSTDRKRGMRLACQTRVTSSITVEVPKSSITTGGNKILTETEKRQNLATHGNPPVQTRVIELPLPTREEDTPDVERMEREIGHYVVGLEMLRELPTRLREGEFRGTAVLCEDQLVDFKPATTQVDSYAAAFDIGTTTLVGSLIESATGRVCAGSASMNPQIRFGDDVLSRIFHATQSPDGLEQLRSEIVAAMNGLLSDLAGQVGISHDQIYHVAVAGNTTMQHLFAGIDPRALGQVPFVPALGRGFLDKAEDFGLRIHRCGRVFVFPVIGGFVGGDTVAGMLVTDIANAKTPTLLVDIGTNGEIVLCHDSTVLAASCAAGPAFEGARISCGMRAAEGAIEEVVFEGDVRVKVIGGAAPVGVCGSALIDVAAELLRAGILTPEGLLLGPDDIPAETPQAIRKRVTSDSEGPVFLLTYEKSTQTGKPILLTQRDLRELQLATGAIRAGMAILLRRVGLEARDLDQLLVAGAFGNYLRLDNAKRIGLLPTGLESKRIRFMGNTSLAGAQMVAASCEARKQAEYLARRAKHMDLSLDPNFQMEFVEAMFFPGPVEGETNG